MYRTRCVTGAKRVSVSRRKPADGLVLERHQLHDCMICIQKIYHQSYSFYAWLVAVGVVAVIDRISWFLKAFECKSFAYYDSPHSPHDCDNRYM